MKTGIIIVAGGAGSRMGTETPKQFLPVARHPLLMHTIRQFQEALPDAKLIVVLPGGQQTPWTALCEKYRFSIEHTVVPGGNTRFESVKNGLSALEECEYVGVHDGVRPFVGKNLIIRALECAQNFGASVPVLPVTDSLREVAFCAECQDMSEIIDSTPIDRNRFVAVQTPQFFRYAMLMKAYEQDYVPEFTDDASVVEAAGYAVTLVPGETINIKVTTPVDLAAAEALAAVFNKK